MKISDKDSNVPAPSTWYCPACKRIRSNEYPNGRDTVLGVQHGDTLTIQHKGLRVEIEAEGRVGITCRNCGAFVEVFSEDWPEIRKFKARLATERATGGPAIRSREVIGYTIDEGK